MLAMKSVLKVAINGRDYEFNCSPDSPLPDAIEANSQFEAFLLGKLEQGKANQENSNENTKIQVPKEFTE